MILTACKQFLAGNKIQGYNRIHMTSAIPVCCSTNWAYMLQGSLLFIYFKSTIAMSELTLNNNAGMHNHPITVKCLER